MLYRDSRLREKTTKSGLGPTLTVTSSVELWTSTRELRNFRGCHPCKLKCYIGIVGFERRQQSRVLDRPLQLLLLLCFGFRRENLEIIADAIHANRRFRETTTKSGLGPNFTVTSSVVLLTSTRELRNLRGCHPCKLKCYIGIVGFERRQQSRVLDRPLQLLVQLSFGLRRENLEIFADAIHASINEQLIQIYDGIFGFRLKCRLSFGLRQENLEIFADAIHASINEQLIQIYNSLLCCRLKCYIGIVGFEGRQQSRVLDRPLQLLVQLSFGLRRENLEIFIKMLYRDTRFRETTTKSGLGPNFPVTTSVVLWTSMRELRNFRRCHPCKY
ncbi:uncharacterized protein V1477_007687 [Vespula maculifrons]|uniref:Maturase K n=1 Tax=Vespula maculifrons TaxID=7453 RepID=A0ABD2CG93_VESMC